VTTVLASWLSILEQAWKAHGADDGERLHRGLPAGKVIGSLNTAGLPAPAEIVTWFGWRNGSRDYGPPNLSPVNLNALSLDLSLITRAIEIEVAAGLTDDVRPGSPAPGRSGRPVWDFEWLPIAENERGDVLFVDLATSHREVAVHYKSRDWADVARPRADSLADLMQRWIEIMLRNSRSPETGSWDIDVDGLPPRLRDAMP
jgi:hypothetical protein